MIAIDPKLSREQLLEKLQASELRRDKAEREMRALREELRTAKENNAYLAARNIDYRHENLRLKAAAEYVAARSQLSLDMPDFRISEEACDLLREALKGAPA